MKNNPTSHALSRAKGRKRFSVGGYSGSRHAYTDTLAEAKSAGERIAKKEEWRGKWNVMYIPVHIFERSGGKDSMYYKPTSWVMFVPVRGSGVRADKILETMQKREGVGPMVWKRDGKGVSNPLSKQERKQSYKARKQRKGMSRRNPSAKADYTSLVLVLAAMGGLLWVNAKYGKEV